MYKALVASIAVNVLQLVVWTPHFNPSSGSLFALVYNLLQLVIQISLLVSVYSAYRKNGSVSLDKFVRNLVAKYQRLCLLVGLGWVSLTTGIVILLLTRFEGEITENIYILGVIAAMLISFSSQCEMFATFENLSYGFLRVTYFCLFVIVTLCSGVLVGKMRGLEALVESQWLLNFLFALQVIHSETLFYILMVPFTAFLCIGCWLLFNCLSASYIVAQAGAGALLLGMVVWLCVFVRMICGKLRYGEVVRHNANITLDKIVMERQLEGRSVMLIESMQGHCSICLLGYEAKDKVVTLKCEHRLHYACAEEWFERKPECPVCRMQVLQEH